MSEESDNCVSGTEKCMWAHKWTLNQKCTFLKHFVLDNIFYHGIEEHPLHIFWHIYVFQLLHQHNSNTILYFVSIKYICKLF